MRIKTICILTALFLLISSITNGLLGYAQEGTAVVDYNFDDGNYDGWVVKEPDGSSVTVVDSSSDGITGGTGKSVRLFRPSGIAGYVKFTKTLDQPLKGTVTGVMRIALSNDQKGKGPRFKMLNSNGDMVVAIGFIGGDNPGEERFRTIISEGKSNAPFAITSSKVFYDIKIVLDCDTGKYDIYIYAPNGTEVAKALEEQMFHSPLPTDVSTIEFEIVGGAQGSNCGLAYIDTVKVYDSKYFNDLSDKTNTEQPIENILDENVSQQSIKVFIDGQLQSYDQSPVLMNSRVLVPLRGIFESLGAIVSWDESTSTVTAEKGDRKIVLKIGDSAAMINNEMVMLDQPAELINGRTMVPVRFVAEALRANVDWEGSTQSVIIKTAK